MPPLNSSLKFHIWTLIYSAFNILVLTMNKLPSTTPSRSHITWDFNIMLHIERGQGWKTIICKQNQNNYIYVVQLLGDITYPCFDLIHTGLKWKSINNCTLMYFSVLVLTYPIGQLLTTKDTEILFFFIFSFLCTHATIYGLLALFQLFKNAITGVKHSWHFYQKELRVNCDYREFG